MARKRAQYGTSPPLHLIGFDRMKTTPADWVPMRVTQPEPIDARFIQMVCEYLERVEHRITTKSEPRHMRLTAPRKTLVSDSVAEVISSAASGWHIDETPVTAWQWASVVLWARELAQAEMLGGSRAHVDSDYARSVRALWHPPRPIPHRISGVQASHTSGVTYP